MSEGKIKYRVRVRGKKKIRKIKVKNWGMG
jgi:hypothetical protein